MEERLQKIIAQAGVTSRRKAEELISTGRVSVNNILVTKLGAKADPTKDEIRIDGKLFSKPQTKQYIMLHKPAGYVTTLCDPEGRPIVTDLITGISERLYPVGRLDYNSEGLLLLTNDGDFAFRLAHPRYTIPKTYRVKLQGKPNRKHLEVLNRGVSLEDGMFRPLEWEMEKENPKSTWLILTILEGRNRVIRRAFEKIGLTVARLMRIAFGPVQLGNLPPGRWRYLTKKELQGFARPDEQ